MAMELIETVELTSTTSNLTFSGIPQDATDLYLAISARSNDINFNFAEITLEFNGDTGSNYSWLWLQGDGSSVTSSSSSGTSLKIENSQTAANVTANTFSSVGVYISNYTSTTARSISSEQVTENNATTAYQLIQAGSYTGTSAISSIKVSSFFGSFVAGCSFSLYKIY